MKRWELEDMHPDLDVREEMNQGRIDAATEQARIERRARERAAYGEMREATWDPKFPPPPF